MLARIVAEALARYEDEQFSNPKFGDKPFDSLSPHSQERMIDKWMPAADRVVAAIPDAWHGVAGTPKETE